MGSYQFTVSCFGSHGAPSSFSYLMTEVLRGIQQCLSYIDDILTHTRTHEDQLKTLEKVFKALRENNLKINPEKCIFGAMTMEYLGFQLSKDGI